MNEEQQKILLKVAKAVVGAAVCGEPIPAVPEVSDSALREKCGCFVTLKNGQELRGCIGQFKAERPLIEMISRVGISSATQDPRFTADRIGPGELEELHVEISVLSPMKKTADPLSLELGVHGIYITDGFRSGCFLPQVAAETGWGKEEFLDYCCCHKAGLQAGAWRDDSKVEVFLFTADVFGADWSAIEDDE